MMNISSFYRPALVALGLGLVATTASAGCGGAVSFAKGASSAELKGSVKGYDVCEYTLRAQKGQVMNATLSTKGNLDAIVYAPVEHDFASGPLTLPQSGQYTIRVLHPRATARKGGTDTFKMTVSIKSAGTKASAPVVASAASAIAGAKAQPTKATKPTQKPARKGAQCEGSGIWRHGVAMMSGSVAGDNGCDFNVTLNKGDEIVSRLVAPAGIEAWLTKGSESYVVDDASPITITESGDYTLHVGLTRNAARKGEGAKDFALSLTRK